MPVEKALGLIPLIYEELVDYWGPRVYVHCTLAADWTLPRKRAPKIQVELAMNATVRQRSAGRDSFRFNASRSTAARNVLRETIARPKVGRNEWDRAERGRPHASRSPGTA